MDAIYLFIVVGVLLLGVAITGTLLKDLPISTSIIYLVVGIGLGSAGLGLLSLDVMKDAKLLEHLTEIAVLVSLFTVGLSLRRSPTDRGWLMPVRLATITMVLTVGALTLVGTLLLNLPLGAAILLGAILAPTDPVLASDVQVKAVTDRDRLRYSLSGEAALNDCTAFPFVMLGLGLLALHPQENAGFANLWTEGAWSLGAWFGWDVAWAIVAGLLIGGLTGLLVGRVILRLENAQADALGLHAFLVLGLIALAYGLTELVYGYGFLAVFATGYALRYLELRASDHATAPPELPSVALDETEAAILEQVDSPEAAAHYLAVSLGRFNQQLEHVLEAAVVVVLGSMITRYLTWDVLWFAPLLFVVLRPAATAISMIGSDSGGVQRALTGWFGIRGIGSIYYLSYAIVHGFEGAVAERIAELVFSTIMLSIIIHGISVTPLMNWYERLVERRAGSTETSNTEKVKV